MRCSALNTLPSHLEDAVRAGRICMIEKYRFDRSDVEELAAFDFAQPASSSKISGPRNFFGKGCGRQSGLGIDSRVPGRQKR